MSAPKAPSRGWPQASRLLDADEVAVLLNVPPSWIRAQARADRIPHIRLGRYVRFRADDLEAFIAAATRNAVRD